MCESRQLASDAATVAAGRALAAAWRASGERRLVIYLYGDLGAGKTTFARGFLAGLGHTGRVPSPTYTLVEPYTVNALNVYHIDLYRLADAAEVDDLGIIDLDVPPVAMLIEWPERGGSRLPAADLRLYFALAGEGRALRIQAGSPAGERIRDLEHD